MLKIQISALNSMSEVIANFDGHDILKSILSSMKLFNIIDRTSDGKLLAFHIEFLLIVSYIHGICDYFKCSKLNIAEQGKFLRNISKKFRSSFIE